MTPNRPAAPAETAQSAPLKALTVQLKNQPGAAAEIARALADAGVNEDAVEVEVLGQYGFYRFFTDTPFKAESVLRSRGYIVTTTDILEVVLQNRPGELARALETLARGGVNVDSCFGSSWGADHDCRLYLRVSDVAKAHKLLHAASIPSFLRAH